MKKTLITLAVAVMAFSAFAQGKKKPVTAPKKVHCPVMKQNTVDIAAATKSKLYADYKGRRYFFCCGMCPPMFKKDPAKFSKGAESIATPKKK